MQKTGIVYLSLSVFSLHMGLILWLFISFEAMPVIKNRQKMIVKTVTLNPPAIPKKEVIPPKATVKKKVPVPLPPSPPVPVKKPPPPKTIAKSKTKKQELIAKAQESIAKIQKTSDKVKSNLAVPQLTLDGMQEIESSYRDEIAGLLKLLLRLPEYGQVKIKLTLNRSGDFIKMTVVNSESDINKRYIEKTIPGIKFPSFGDNFKGLTEYTFLISLSNDF